MEINGKKVVVIGGASGMGRASAELLAERGAEVAVLDREGSDGQGGSRRPQWWARRVLSGRRHRLQGNRGDVADRGRQAGRPACHR